MRVCKTNKIKNLFTFITVFLFPFLLFSQDDTVAIDPAEKMEQYTDEATADTIENYFWNNDEAGTAPLQVEERRLPDSLLQALQNDKAFWYANGEWSKPQQQKAGSPVQYKTPFYRQQWFRSLMWIIIVGCFVAVIIWYLSLNDVGIFRRKNVAVGAEEEALSADNIFEINYSRDIAKATAEGNYRLAVRLLFLQLLKNLSEKEIIHYKQDRTNFDYLLQLQQSAYYSDFFRLARNYEYAWYGKFDMSKETFSAVKKDFENFNYRIS